jgi:hypothetical protein
MGRGAASGDLDNDGRVDLVVSHVNEPVALLANETETQGGWLTVELVGTVSPRDAIGAQVKLKSPMGEQVAQRIGGGSYASSESPLLNFGLGKADKVDLVEVTWPSGKKQQLTDVAINTRLQIIEPRD